MPGAGTHIPVEGAGGVVADLDGAGLAALAADGDLPVPEVDVAAPRGVGVVADSCYFGLVDPGRLEHGDDRRVAAVLEAPACTGPLQPRKLDVRSPGGLEL